MWFTKVSAWMFLDALKKKINPFDVEHYQNLVEPHWYER